MRLHPEHKRIAVGLEGNFKLNGFRQGKHGIFLSLGSKYLRQIMASDVLRGQKGGW